MRPRHLPRVEALWIRLLGLVYLTAFASLLPQIRGLMGADGIAPAAAWLAQLHNALGTRAYRELPTLLWLSSSDTALITCVWLGCFAAIVMISGKLTRTAAVVCWMLYLSIVAAGDPFMNFQWDALLLEAGFLAIFTGAPILTWTYRFLLFRLMVESGVVKLTSHDPNWRNLHALRFHFLTQPLPNPIAYYAYQLPGPVLDALTGITFFVELICPFFLFGPKWPRRIAAALLIVLQLMIALTGNFAFFNLLTVALCAWALDDELLKGSRFSAVAMKPKLAIACSIVAALLMFAGASQVAAMFWPKIDLLPAWFQRLEIVNPYGLFASMTTTRPELVIEGSDDGSIWKEYTFRYKPGPLKRGLPIVAPYQPRLDWQMWFAALGSYRENTWVGGLLYGILTGNKTELSLLDPPPFAKPPKMARVLIYDYRFTTIAVRQKTGNVWTREPRGIWYGPVSLAAVSSDHP